MVKILIATLLVAACAGCAGASGGSSSASGSSITMYGVIDEGVSVRK
jgi:ABC-type glycerol-3-phosphate transport system substrate-binding protein